MLNDVKVDVIFSRGTIGCPFDGAAVLVHQTDIVEPEFKLIACIPQTTITLDGIVVAGVEFKSADVVEVGGGAGVERFQGDSG